MFLVLVSCRTREKKTSIKPVTDMNMVTIYIQFMHITCLTMFNIHKNKKKLNGARAVRKIYTYNVFLMHLGGCGNF